MRKARLRRGWTVRRRATDQTDLDAVAAQRHAAAWDAERLRARARQHRPHGSDPLAGTPHASRWSRLRGPRLGPGPGRPVGIALVMLRLKRLRFQAMGGIEA